MILDKRRLKILKDNVYIVDSASMPGGMDFDFAKKHNIKYNHYLSIPSKIAPKTAAGYIKSIINKKSE